MRRQPKECANGQPVVIPAQAGIHFVLQLRAIQIKMDPRLRGDDVLISGAFKFSSHALSSHAVL